MKMRITGGDFKGRTLSFPASVKERPTSDFLRETFFNLLGSFTDERFLDLFAGSGSVGLEAASRGAGYVYLIEKNKKLADFIKKNIQTLSLEHKCKVINTDIEAGLRDLARIKYKPGIIFADPPYNKNLVSLTLRCLSLYQVAAKDGVIVIQHSAKENYKEYLPEKIHQVKQKKYGENVLTFFKGE